MFRVKLADLCFEARALDGVVRLHLLPNEVALYATTRSSFLLVRFADCACFRNGVSCAKTAASEGWVTTCSLSFPFEVSVLPCMASSRSLGECRRWTKSLVVFLL